MKRKVGLFLLAIMLAVTLGTTLVVSLVMYRLVTARQAQEIHNIEGSLSERFGIFEVMLRSHHAHIRSHMERVLPEIAAEIDASGRSPGDLSKDEMDALVKKYDVEYIYFVDRAHKVFQTNLATDLNLVFPESDFTRFLDKVFDNGRVMSDGIDLSSQTGTLQTYSYFGPRGKDYLIETSTQVKNSLSRGGYPWMSRYFFEDLFSDARRNNDYVKDIDIYLMTPAGVWSLLTAGKKLDAAIADRAVADGRYEVRDGRLLTVYSRHDTAPSQMADDPFTHKSVIRQVTYDDGLAREAVLQVVASSLVVLVLALPLVFWIASRLLQKQLLDPLLNLRVQARAITQGDLDHVIGGTDRRDEIGHLAASFATMRDAVRSTITDLKETNKSIERFVPHAFLTIMGKTSILSVVLGDNRRHDMTVLFSDIRNFTSLSEQMTPDENFAFINSYLERMGPVIRDHNGFIDKYIGDAIMALFENADDALRASLAMLGALDDYNAGRVAAGQEAISIGIGLNTGSLMLGTIGEKHRMDGTVISDAVNLAARVEGMTKVYKVSLLISQNTYDHLADPAAYAIRPVDVAVVKGKTWPIALFEVFERDAPDEWAAKAATRAVLTQGVEALARGDAVAARALFDQGLALNPQDQAALTLRQRCDEG